MKLLIFISLTLGGLLGAWLGDKMDGGFGMWSMLLGLIIGPLLGIFVGYRIGQKYFE